MKRAGLLTAEENRARNIQRIMFPPAPTVRDRARRVLHGVEEWWRRHVTQRRLYRLLDRARLVDVRRAALPGGLDPLRSSCLPSDEA